MVKEKENKNNSNSKNKKVFKSNGKLFNKHSSP